MYRNEEQTAYDGRCPSCGAPVQALIGPDGTDHRVFMAE
jgi:predicted DCC family thiol-disulfide oxidoreductase YuxK